MEIKWKCLHCDTIFISVSEEDYLEESRDHLGECCDDLIICMPKEEINSKSTEPK